MHTHPHPPETTLSTCAAAPVEKARQHQELLRRVLIPSLVFLLLILGCSAADLVQRERATPVPTATQAALLATFTPTPAPPAQTVVIVTPPADDRPGVIIVPPGMDPSSVVPVLPSSTPTPSPTLTPEPPTPTAIVVPPVGGQPESPLPPPVVIVGPGTPAPPGEILLIPTDTPTPTFTPEPTATPTPFVLVESGLVALRTGPGLEYPLLAQLGPGIPVAIIGRTEDSSWLEICCVSGQTVWVVATHIQVGNDISQIPVSFAPPPPAPTPSPFPTETPSPTPSPTATLYPFERAIGPQFFPTTNEYVTIWAKFYIGVEPFEDPAEGYSLSVKFEGFDRPNALGDVASRDVFEFSAPPGSGNRVQYNYKYEYRPPDPSTINSDATRLQLIGTGTWSVYVTDGSGRQLSEAVTFTTAPSNPNREIYIGWVRVR